MFMDPEEYGRMKERFPKFNEPWTMDDVAELQAMAQDKVPLDTMVENLQRTRNAVRMKLKALGMWEGRPAAAPWHPEEDQELIQMYEVGEPFEDIAAHFGRSVRAIVSRLVKMRVSLFE